MKIGIVTQPLIANYGCFLQNFALQEVLKQLGHQPQTIDYLPCKGVFRYFLHVAKVCVCRCLLGKKLPLYPYHIHRIPIFQQFVETHLHVTPSVYRYRSSLVTNYGFQAVITGSDQVWRPAFNHSLQDMFLRFVPSRKARKIAYAASFGVDCWEYTPAEEVACRRWARQLDAVSVRECSAISLCQEHLGITAQEVLDPTLLVDRSVYENVCQSVPVASAPFVAVYVLELTPAIKALVDALAASLHVTLKYFTANETATISVPEWLAMFRDAAYVITDSFHGTVFSILFQKDFISIGNSKAGLSRFYSLLSKFQLEQRLYVPGKTDTQSLKEPVDWLSVNQLLNEFKKESLSFLQDSLSN